MKRGSLILVGGGVRSGKSDFALRLARRLGQRRLFIATAQARDVEMAERIRRHQQTRGGDFVTLEEPLLVPEVIGRQSGHDVVVIDCLTLWLSNLLLNGKEPETVLACVSDLIAALRSHTDHAVVITNEVGMGIVPETHLGRVFRDLAGEAHQRLSRSADEIYFGALGTILRLKPGPVTIQAETA